MAHRSCSIELRHLRYFIAAADHGSFRKAGVALQITESAISRRIRDLEDGIGVSLFTWHNGGVRITAAGRQLLTFAIGALDQVEQARFGGGLLGRGETGAVHIGILGMPSKLTVIVTPLRREALLKKLAQRPVQS